MDFGLFVKELREEQEISTRELSKRIGKGSNYISSIENGRNKQPSPLVAKKILTELSIGMDRIPDILVQFNIIEKKDRIRLLFDMDDESKKKEIKESIIQSLELMDVDMLSAIHAIVNRHEDFVIGVYSLEENNKRSLASLKDYLDYLVNKE